MEADTVVTTKRQREHLFSHDTMESEDLPAKKKLRTKLVDIFNMCNKDANRMKIFLRVKPFTEGEDSSEECFEVQEEENRVTTLAPKRSHSYKTHPSHSFTFSRIFNKDTSQKQLFEKTMLGLTEAFIGGENILVFTYGVTSSGKTYTLHGSPQNAGLLPRCLDVLFNSISGKQMSEPMFKPTMFNDTQLLTSDLAEAQKRLKSRILRMSVADETTVMTLLGDEMESMLSDTTDTSSCPEEPLPDVENRDREEIKVDVGDKGTMQYSVWVSFVEIYNEQVFDLLEPMSRRKNARRPVLKICDDKNGNPFVKGLKEIQCDSADEAYRLMVIGQRNLQTACTQLNHCSSRSHCIFNIKIICIGENGAPKVSMLSLCDLAGSERYSKTQATADRLKEAGNINTSLMTLGRCIETLRHNQLHKDQQKIVPFRDSKLTRMLQNFFNGRGKAAMIVNVSQCVSMFDDTHNVFKFSAIAKQVKYIEKPVKMPPPPKKKKKIPAHLRPSIPWETKGGELTEHMPVFEEEEEESDEEDESDQDVDEVGSTTNGADKNTIRELQGYIKTLEIRNERLVEMIQEELEVTETLTKEKDDMQEFFDTMRKEYQSDAEELSDKRVQGIMEIYEERLARIQRKVDEEDEWVSSLLYHQEKTKVQEKDSKIKELESKLKTLEEAQSKEKDSKIKELESKLKTLEEAQSKASTSADDSMELRNSVMVDTLTKRLEEALEGIKERDEKLEELQSMLTEAGEVYQQHVKKISDLEDCMEEQKKSMMTQMEDLKKQLDGSITAVKDHQTELVALREETSLKLASKDATIASLEGECQELQGEIERLQDQMSQLDEQSRLQRSVLESSNGSMDKSTTSGKSESQGASALDTVETVRKLEEEVETLKGTLDGLKKERDDLSSEVDRLAAVNKELCAEKETLKLDLTKLQGDFADQSDEKQTLSSDHEALNGEHKRLKEREEKLIEDVNRLQNQLQEVKDEKDGEVAKLVEKIEKFEEDRKKLEIELKDLTSAAKSREQSEEQRHVELLEQKTEIENLVKENTVLVDSEKQKTEKLAKLQQELSQLTEENAKLLSQLETLRTKKVKDEEDCRKSTLENKELQEEISQMKAENATLRSRQKEMEQNLDSHAKDSRYKTEPLKPQELTITDMVRQIEDKTSPMKIEQVSSDEDEEIVFNPASVAAAHSVDHQPVDLTTRLKDAELANAALRSKLKREEDDFFRREQALIHGYTAEIDNLKYELAKMKTKDVPGKGGTQRRKRKAAAMDVSSTSSALSESLLESGSSLTEDLLPGKVSKTDLTKSTDEAAEIICAELGTVQQQYLSLTSAYQQLKALVAKQSKSRFSVGGQASVGTDSVIVGTPRKMSLVKDRRSEFIVTDSVLQFENEEYIIGLEEMKQKISQQEQELSQKEEALVTERRLHNDAQLRLDQIQGDLKRQMEETVEELRTRLQEVDTELNATSKQLEAKNDECVLFTRKVEEIKYELAKVAEDLSEAAYNEAEDLLITNKRRESESMGELQQLEIFVKILKKAVSTDNKKTHEEQRALSDQLSQHKIDLHEATVKLEKSEAARCDLEEQMKALNVQVKASKTELQEATVKLERSESGKCALEEQVEALKAQVKASKADLEAHKKEFGESLKFWKETASSKEEDLSLQQQIKQQLDAAQVELKKKSSELEHLQKDRQEEEAEFSQKLLCLEKEKRILERKTVEWQRREEELSLKCQRLEANQQQEHQHQENLRELMKNLEVEKKDLKGLLEMKTAELLQKTEEMGSSKSNHVEKSLELEKEKNKEALQELKKRSLQNDKLQDSLEECHKMLEQQEGIIESQDQDLALKGTEVEELKSELVGKDGKLQKAEADVMSLQTQIGELEGLKAELEEDKKKIQRAEAEILSLKSQVGELEGLKAEMEEDKKKIQRAEAEILSLKSQVRELDGLKAETEEDKMKIKKAEAEILSLKLQVGELEILKAEMEEDKMKIQKGEAEILSLKSQVGELDGLKAEMEEDKIKIQKAEAEILSLKSQVGELEGLKAEMEEDKMKIQKAEAEILSLKSQDSSEKNEQTKSLMQAKEENRDLHVELKQLKVDLKEKEEELKKLRKDSRQLQEGKKALEAEIENEQTCQEEYVAKIETLQKEVAKYERMNKRNKEEMGNWKEECDEREHKLEHLYKTKLQENSQLEKEIEKLKKDNAVMAKNMDDITKRKDSVIAELRKSNNTLSIQLADSQGMSPPPKIDTPDRGFPNRFDLVDDVDTTGHLEMDATPPIAAKKGRKRTARSHSNSSSSSVDPEAHNPRVLLRPIKEQNELDSSPGPLDSPLQRSPSKIGTASKVAKLASDAIMSLSPLTRAAKKHKDVETKLKPQRTTEAPFNVASFIATDDVPVQNENNQPASTRRSSRLRSRKH